jgi:S1-C subfamily serine protease
MEQNFHFTNLMASTDRQLLDVYSSTVTGVVKKAAQAVVHLRVSKKIQEARTKKIVGQYALGSGFVISSDGYIITNHHVIDNTDSVTVIFGDGTEHSATLAGTDPSTDIAVIKVYNEELYTLQFLIPHCLNPVRLQ